MLVDKLFQQAKLTSHMTRYPETGRTGLTKFSTFNGILKQFKTILKTLKTAAPSFI